MIKKLRTRLTVLFTAFTGLVLTAVMGVALWFSINQIQFNNLSWFSNRFSEVIDYAINLNYQVTNTSIVAEEPYIIGIRKNGVEIPVKTTWEPTESKENLIEKARYTSENNGWTETATEIYVGQIYTEYAMDITGEAAPIPESTSEFTSPNLPALPSQEEVAVMAEIGDNNYAEFHQAIPPADGPLGTVVTIAPQESIQTNTTFTLVGENGKYRGTSVAIHLNDEIDQTPVLFEITVLEDLRAQNRTIFFTVLGYSLLYLVGLGLLALANWFLAKLVIKPTELSIQQQADFVAAASHELRSPLAVIRSSLSAANASPNQADAKKYRSAAEAEAERMGRLVEDLLLLAGGDAGSWKMQSNEVDLDTVLIETAEQFTSLAHNQNLLLHLDLPEETLPTVRGDSDRIRQILSVLLNNALQYAPAESTITLSARRKKSKIEIDVADTGPGISDENKEKIFNRFYRAEESRSSKAHFGLGLSVAQELAMLHGGILTVFDTTPEKGATFRLTLPVQGSRPLTKNKLIL